MNAIKHSLAFCLLFTFCGVNGFSPISTLTSTPTSSVTTKLFSTQFDTRGMWNNGNAFGKGQFTFYRSQQDWMKPFPAEDRDIYPQLFTLPKGVYEISSVKPLGIVFEEIEAGKGVYVTDIVEGGNADIQGVVQKGDILIGVTAIKVIGAKWERRLIPARDLSFDTIVDAISSNEPKWGCEDVVLQFERPSEVEDEQAVKDHLSFYNPPGDSAWRTN